MNIRFTYFQRPRKQSQHLWDKGKNIVWEQPSFFKHRSHLFLKNVHHGICLRLAVANMLSYCICLIHEDRITRQTHTKAEIWKLFSSFGRIYKISHKSESFPCNYALILCVCLYFRLEIGHIKQVNAHLECVCVGGARVGILLGVLA